MKKIILLSFILIVIALFSGEYVKAEGLCKCDNNEGKSLPAVPVTEESVCANMENNLKGGDPLSAAQCTFAETETKPAPAVTPAATGGTTGSTGSTGATVSTGKSPSKEEATAMGAKAGEGVVPVKLENPLGETDIRLILGKIVNAGMGILGSVTLLIFVYGGFLWLTSAGSAEKVKKGSQTMMWAVVGLFLIFGSYAILGLVLEGIGAKGQRDFTGLNLQEISESEGVSVEDVKTATEGCYCKTINDGGVVSAVKSIYPGLSTKSVCEEKAGSDAALKIQECEWKTFTSS